MRLMFAMLAAFVLAQCATPDAPEERFSPGASSYALVIIGLAKSPRETQPVYTMLWRQVDPDSGGFAETGGRRSFEAETNSPSAARVPNTPGEFFVAEIDPGVYALDSVFASMREGGVTYIAQGVVEGPERPAFEARAGEVIYLGIWEARLDGASAAVRPWRLEANDMRAAAAAAGAPSPVLLRRTHTRAVACAPRRMGTLSQRQMC